MIKTSLQHQITEQGVKFQIRRGYNKVLPMTAWRDADIGGGIKSLLLSWPDHPEAISTDNALTVPFSEIAELETSLAARLGLPENVSFILDLQHQGTIDQPDFKLMVHWLNPTQQQIWGIRRVGCFLQNGNDYFRLNGFLFPFLQALETFNANIADGLPRLAALAEVMRHLPQEWQRGIKPSGYLEHLKIIPAGAFSLDLRTEDGHFTFTPALFDRPYQDANTSDEDIIHAYDRSGYQPRLALTPEQQRIFSEQRFTQFDDACSFYALGHGSYVVLDENVRRALSIVRDILKKGEAERRIFAKNPRAYIREQLEDTLDEATIESLFIEEYAGYSDRIIDIGLWQRRNVPWIQKEGEQWLPTDASFADRPVNSVTISGHDLILTPENKTALEEKSRAAQQNGKSHFDWEGKTLSVNETIEKIQPIMGRTATIKDDSKKTDKIEQQPRFLLIKDNFDSVEYARAVNAQRRSTNLSDCLPAALKTNLYSYQREGLFWLQQAWRSGLPGVLLADDMGLGKSLQALSFFAWLKEGMRHKRPLLLVAPTGLLENWQNEHREHLHHPGLGEIIEVYGSKLRQYRSQDGSDIRLGSSGLNIERLREADVILTTYETLRDYHHSFGSIPFAAAMFDEMQKIKTPSTQLTDAAQVINADFILGLTGTPVENRLADLWCLYDTMAPGFLGGLKAFSERYEKTSDESNLAHLKEQLAKPQGTIPPVMYRRMKRDVLDGLPSIKIHPRPVQMPTIQADKYEEVVQAARNNTEKGAKLAVLQNLSRISLASFSPFEMDGEQLNGSARIGELFRILDEIAVKQEKVLIFIDLKDWQSRLAAEIQQRYRLSRCPSIINGDKSPMQRQNLVKEFQDAGHGFDVMLLGPKAGGVGYTITAANHVIHLNRWWNPAIEDQSTDRVYRIGQKKEVHVYYPIAEHPVYGQGSFDWRLNALLEKKRYLSREILLPPQSTAEDINTIYAETVMGDDVLSFEQELGNIDRMGGKEFEKWIAARLKNNQFSANLTPDSFDGKMDVLAYRKDGLCLIIQCKQTANYNKPCQEDIVGELLSARHLHKKPTALLVGITNAVSFAKKQQEQAKKSGVVLLTRHDLESFTTQLKQTSLETYAR